MAHNRFSAAVGPQAFPLWPQPYILKDVPSSTQVVRYQAGQGLESYVTLQWCKDIPAKDTTTQTVSQLIRPLGLYQEQVRGQKVEEEIILPPGSSSQHLIPGGIFASQELLQYGRLTYFNADWSISCILHHAGSLPAGRTAIIPAREAGSTGQHPAIKAFHSLVNATDPSSLPKRSSSSEMCWSTCQDGMGLNISGSYFFLGPSESKPFAFSSKIYHYLYVYTFEQIFFTAKPESTNSAASHTAEQAFTSDETLSIREVKFGRKIYVIIESKAALEQHINGRRCGLEWIMLSARLQEPSFAAIVNQETTIRIQTQEGRIFDAVDAAHLETTIDEYFESTCAENPLSPLAFQVKDLDGTPVSLLTTAFINSQHSPC